MDKLVVKLFGLNRTNFFGWIVAGTLAILVAGFLGFLAATSTDLPREQRPLMEMLGAIAFLLLGILCVLLQMYLAMYAEKLEKQSLESADPEPSERPTQTGVQSSPLAGP